MAVNETTGVDPEVDRFAVFQVSASQYVNFNATWPRVDGGPLVGANPDYKYYKKTSTSPPVVDHRFTIATVWDKVDTDPAPPEGHPHGVYTQTHSATKLAIEDLKIQVETEFQRQVEIAIPSTAVPSQLAAQIDAIVRKQDGAALTTRQQSKRETAKTTGDILAQLEVRRDALFAAIDADEDYDITEGWEVV